MNQINGASVELGVFFGKRRSEEAATVDGVLIWVSLASQGVAAEDTVAERHA